ncbi:hypothetical protein [Streptomyces sp. ISL-98]|uniref:hypothetical protein n=1 Tax=Streptomyces sp. ISL-98 TaxID=2819192 RepID=UPI002035B826|nr:hypothetical protein [Streptomyces sp. ISL-98]
MILGVHGVLGLKPWIRRAYEDEELEEDTFSLVVKRTMAYGWSSFHAGGPETGRWGHNDAGGDWSQDGRVRQLAWLQVDVPGDPRGQRLPVLPAATVLGDVLHRVGRFQLTGLHTLAPMDLAVDSRADLANAADWFSLAEQAEQGGESGEFTLSVLGTEKADLPGRAAGILASALDRTYGCMTIEASPADDGTARAGLSLPLAGELQTEGLRHGPAFRCGVREWSLDVAAWATEVFIDAVRESGPTGPVLLTVSKMSRPAAA